MKLSECLRRLVTMRSACNFQAEMDCYRNGGPQQYRCQELVQRTGSATSQDSDDGKIGSDVGRERSLFYSASATSWA
jgi:hypothetical protein